MSLLNPSDFGSRQRSQYLSTLLRLVSVAPVYGDGALHAATGHTTRDGEVTCGLRHAMQAVWPQRSVLGVWDYPRGLVYTGVVQKSVTIDEMSNNDMTLTLEEKSAPKDRQCLTRILCVLFDNIVGLPILVLTFHCHSSFDHRRYGTLGSSLHTTHVGALDGRICPLLDA